MLVSAKDIDKLETAMQEGISIGRTEGINLVISQMLETLSIEEIADILKKDKSEIEEVLSSKIH